MLNDAKHGMESKVFSRFRARFERKSQCHVVVVGNIVALWNKELRGQHCEHDIQAMVPFHPAVVQSF